MPYATQTANADPGAQQRAHQKAEHVRVGYDAAMLGMLFPGKGITRGCYWLDDGHLLRERLNAMTDQDIKSQFDALMTEAGNDLRDRIPGAQEALWIWRMSFMSANTASG